MNALDWILMAIVALSVLSAAMRGFLYEIWMMAATVAAILIAAWEYRDLAASLAWLQSPEIEDFVAFAAIVIVLLLVAAAIGRLARGAVHAVGLGFLDRLLGAGVGLVRGLILGAVLVFLLTAYPIQPRWVAGSRLAPGFRAGGQAMEKVVPDSLAQRFEQGLRDQLRPDWREFHSKSAGERLRVPGQGGTRWQ